MTFWAHSFQYIKNIHIINNMNFLKIFLMWTIFKVFIEFITRLLPFHGLAFWPQGMWDLHFPTRDWAYILCSSVQFSSVAQSCPTLRLFVTPWIAARQASLSIANSRSSLRLTSIESVMPSSHLILCRPLLLLPPIPPSIRVFSNESTLRPNVSPE